MAKNKGVQEIKRPSYISDQDISQFDYNSDGSLSPGPGMELDIMSKMKGYIHDESEKQ